MVTSFCPRAGLPATRSRLVMMVTDLHLAHAIATVAWSGSLSKSLSVSMWRSACCHACFVRVASAADADVRKVTVANNVAMATGIVFISMPPSQVVAAHAPKPTGFALAGGHLVLVWALPDFGTGT